MPRTPMSDTPLSPVSEYYKVLNKRIMEEKTAEEIANTILYFPVTNGQGESSTMKGAKLIRQYADQQAASLQSTLDRYEKALTKIAQMTVSDSMRDIASNALNDK